jgi:hypothetical protein
MRKLPMLVKSKLPEFKGPVLESRDELYTFAFSHMDASTIASRTEGSQSTLQPFRFFKTSLTILEAWCRNPSKIVVYVTRELRRVLQGFRGTQQFIPDRQGYQ